MNMKYVKCISESIDLTVGKIYKVIRINSETITWLDDFSQNSGAFPCNYLIEVTEQEYNKQEGIINQNYYFY